jgi:hypothetical protein
MRVPPGRDPVYPEPAHAVGVPLPRLHDYSRKNITDAVHQSLRRMRTDYLDIVQFHFSPAREVLEQEGAVETLHDLSTLMAPQMAAFLQPHAGRGRHLRDVHFPPALVKVRSDTATYV